MKPIRTKTELLDLAAACAPTAAVARRLRERGARVFGGVTSPEGFPGYVVRCHDGRLIGFWADDKAYRWRVDYPTDMPAAAVEITGERL